MEVERPEKQCALCGSQSLGPMYDPAGLSIWQCADCKLVFHELALKQDFDTRTQYSSDYYKERKDYYKEDDAQSKKYQETMDSFSAGLDLLEKHRPSRGKLVDVGCGYGSFLALAIQRGWQARGVDISEHAASVASKKAGAEVFAGTLDDAGFADGEFDAVALNDSFEHFADPNAQLKQISRILKPDGVLFLNTPNQSALLRVAADAIYRLSAGAIAYPVKKLYHEFHLYYYTEATLRRILEKHGLEIVELVRKPIPFIKARGNYLERLIVRSFSYVESMLGREFEILAVARKHRSSEK